MPSDPSCVFCKIVAGQIPSAAVYSDDQVYAFLDIGPLAEGHLLLIPRSHYQRMSDVPPEEMAALARHIPRLGRQLREATGAAGFNLLCNEGAVAGQEVPHVHFHLIPRAAGDGLGYRWNAGKYPAGGMEAMLAKYKAAKG
jgi:histidine triad (HIT) family protein